MYHSRSLVMALFDTVVGTSCRSRTVSWYDELVIENRKYFKPHLHTAPVLRVILSAVQNVMCPEKTTTEPAAGERILMIRLAVLAQYWITIDRRLAITQALQCISSHSENANASFYKILTYISSRIQGVVAGLSFSPNHWTNGGTIWFLIACP